MRFLHSVMFVCPFRARELVRLNLLWSAQVDIAAIARMKGRQEAVVVARRNGVEFVIVTTSAPQREAQHPRSDGRDHVVKLVIAIAHSLDETSAGLLFFQRLLLQF